jgi:hypothetical protein
MHVLHFAAWYPNDDDPSLGAFVRSHIDAASKFVECSVIHGSFMFLRMLLPVSFKDGAKRLLAARILGFRDAYEPDTRPVGGLGPQRADSHPKG